MNTKGNLRKSACNLLYSLVYQIVTIAMGLILPRVILVGFGSEINGLLNSVAQAIAYMALFEAGIQSAAAKSLYGTLAKGDKAATNSVLAAIHDSYRRVGMLYFAGLLGLSAAYPLLVRIEELTYFQVFLIILFSGMGNVIAFFKQAKYRILLCADGREYIITNLNTVTSIVGNALKIVLLSLHIQVHVVIALTFLVSFMHVVFIECYVRRNYSWIDLNVIPDHAALKQSKYAFIHQFSGLVFSNTDMILLTVFCDLKAVSVYAVYKLVVGHISSLIMTPFNSCSFVLGQLFHLDRKKYTQLLDGIQVGFSVLVFSVLTVTYLLLTSFMGIYTNGVTDVCYVDRYLPILFVAAEILHLIRVPMMHTVNNCAGHFQETLSRTLMETGINLVVSIVGVKVCGIYGVLIGTIAALLYRSVDFTIYANRAILMRSSAKPLLVYGVNIAAMIAISAILGKADISITTYKQFCVCGLIITPPVMLIYFVVNVCFFRKDLAYLLHGYIKGRLKA